MRTPYGKLVWLSLVMIVGFLLFMPMRSGVEDRLYAEPHSVSLHRGDTYAIQYHLEARSPQSVEFTSTNENVAKVNSRGVVTAVSAGNANIRMLAENGARAQLRVEVIGSPVTNLSLSADRLNLEKGQVSGLRAVFNEGADARLVEWLSADERVAVVDEIGRVTAVGGGSTRIIATTPSGLTASAEVNVHVPATALHISPDGLTLGVGSNLLMGVTYLPDDATDAVTRWTSSDPGVITMDDDGVLHAVGEGYATVSAFTATGLGGSTIINVERSASNFELAPAAATIERDSVINLTTVFTDASGRQEDYSNSHYIQWASTNPQVATVDNGVVKALSSGTARIVATVDGMTAECNLRVQVLVHEVSFSANSIYLLREQTDAPIQLTASVYPADADNKTLTFSSNNELVATVSQTGLVTLTGGYGTAFITAAAEGGAQDQFVVNVVAALPSDITMPDGENFTDAEADAASGGGAQAPGEPARPEDDADDEALEQDGFEGEEYFEDEEFYGDEDPDDVDDLEGEAFDEAELDDEGDED